MTQRELLWCIDSWDLLPRKSLSFWFLNPRWRTPITVSQVPWGIGFQFSLMCDVNHRRVGFPSETRLCACLPEIGGAELLSTSRHCVFSCHRVCTRTGKVELEASCHSEAEWPICSHNQTWASTWLPSFPTNSGSSCFLLYAWRWWGGPPVTTLWVLFRRFLKQRISLLLSKRPWFWGRKKLWLTKPLWKEQTWMTALPSLHTSVSICFSFLLSFLQVLHKIFLLDTYTEKYKDQKCPAPLSFTKWTYLCSSM